MFDYRKVIEYKFFSINLLFINIIQKYQMMAFKRENICILLLINQQIMNGHRIIS